MKCLKSSVTGKMYKAEEALANTLINGGTYVEISEEEYNNSIPQPTVVGKMKKIRAYAKYQQRNNVSTSNKDGKVKFTSKKKRWEHGNNMNTNIDNNMVKNPYYVEAFDLLLQDTPHNKREKVVLGLSMNIEPQHIHIADKKIIRDNPEVLDRRGKSWYNSIVKKYNLEESGINFIKE